MTTPILNPFKVNCYNGSRQISVPFVYYMATQNIFKFSFSQKIVKLESFDAHSVGVHHVRFCPDLLHQGQH